MNDLARRRIHVIALHIATIGMLSALSFAAHAQTTFTVNRTTDTTGSCTATSCNLRQAIAAANATTAKDTIVFNLPTCGTNIINITNGTLHITRPVIIDGTTQPRCSTTPSDDSLIELRGPGVNVAPVALISGLVLDSTSSGSTIRGLAINGFSGNGIGIASSNNSILDDKLGVNASGTQPRANRVGIVIGDSTTGNSVGNSIISANVAIGIDILGDHTQIFGNLIGTAADGVSDLGNGGDGIATVGALSSAIGIAAAIGNTIAFNSGAGIHVGSGSVENEIIGNKIFSNGGLGVRLDGASANHGQVAPAITSVRRTFKTTTTFPIRIDTVITVDGTLANVNNNSGFQVDFYGNDSCDASGAGEGQKFLLTANVNSNGTFSASTSQPTGAFITAIARSPEGDSSQFSQCASVPGFQ